LISIVILSILAGAEIDIFVPSFPEMQKIFHLSPFMIELTLAVNLISQCVSAIFVGNLGDKYGKRSVVLYGIGIFIIGTIICLFTHSYSLLLFGRCLQGVGIAAPAILAFALIIDCFPKSQHQSAFGMVMGISSLALSLAPVVGSYVSLWFGWRGNFSALLILGSITFTLCFFFIQNNSKYTENRLIREAGYTPIFKSSKAIHYILSMSFMAQPYFIFVSLSPILYVADFGIELRHFGLYQGSLALIYAIFSIFSAGIIKIVGNKTSFRIGVSLILIFFTGCIICTTLNIKNALIITGFMMILSTGIVIPLNTMFVLALTSVHGAGSRISAIFHISRLCIMSIGIQIVSYFYGHDFRSIGIAMIICLTIGLILMYRVRKIDAAFQDIT